MAGTPEEEAAKKKLPQDFPDDLRHFDEDAVPDDDVLMRYCMAYMVDPDDMSFEEREQAILLGRMQMFVEAKRAFLNVHYEVNVSPDPVREMKDYFSMFMDVVMPPSSPERIAFEITWQQKLINGYKVAQEKIEASRKRQGFPKLQLPNQPGKLYGPGGQPLNGQG